MHPRNSLPLISLFTAQAISLVGNVFSMIAIPWFVLQTTGSAVQTGVTGFFTVLPVVLAGFLGGALIDKLGYKRTSIFADIASGVTTALIPLLYFTVGLAFWQLMVLVFLGALFDAPGGTGRDALLPDLAEQAGIPIERATSISHIIERSSRLVGAPLAGLLVAVMGTANVLWLNAVSFAISAVIVALLVPASRPAAAETRKGSYFAEMADGLRFMARDGLIMAIVIAVMLTNFLGSIAGGVVLPVYVNRVFGSALNLGLLVAASGGGAVVGGLVYAAIGHRLPRFPVFVGGFILTSLQFWVFAFYASLPVLMAVVFISSIGAGPLNPIIGAVAFERIPPDMRGRVLGSLTAGAWVAMPLGMLMGGFFIEAFGLTSILLGLGSVYLLVTLGMAFIPAMKTMNARPAARTPPAK